MSLGCLPQNIKATAAGDPFINERAGKNKMHLL